VGCHTRQGTMDLPCMVRSVLNTIDAFCSSKYRDDAKTVSIIALACFHPSIKVQSIAIYFFLGDENVEVGEIEDNIKVIVIQSNVHFEYSQVRSNRYARQSVFSINKVSRD
jgi:hypothetical protein